MWSRDAEIPKVRIRDTWVVCWPKYWENRGQLCCFLIKVSFVKCEWVLCMIRNIYHFLNCIFSILLQKWILIFSMMILVTEGRLSTWTPPFCSQTHQKPRMGRTVGEASSALCQCLILITSSVWRVNSWVPLWWPCLCAHRSVWEATSRHQVSAFNTSVLIHRRSVSEVTLVYRITSDCRL